MNSHITKTKQLQNHLEVHWDNQQISHFDYLWLRDNCASAFHPSTKERNFDLLSISDDIAPASIDVTNETLSITWQNDNHTSVYSIEWLLQNDYTNLQAEVSENKFKSKSWLSDYGENIIEIQYEQLLNDDAALSEWLIKLHNVGLVLVRNMAEDGLEKIALRIAHMRETNFGITFNVRSKPNPNNQAYTSEALPLHTDLPNQELPPGFQFLHCLNNQSTGGESIFVDGFAVAEHIRQHHPEEFKILSECTIPFRFHDDNWDLFERKSVISLNKGAIDEINYNAHIATTFRLSKEMMRPFYRAYRLFMSIMRDPTFLIKFKLSSKEMVVFDNRRVLHGRTEFDPQTGARHLRGCYIDRGDLKSRIRVLKSRLAKP